MTAETYTIDTARLFVTVNLPELADLLVDHLAPKMSGQWHEDALRDFCVQTLEPVMEDRIDRRVTDFMQEEEIITQRDVEDMTWEACRSFHNDTDWYDIFIDHVDMYELADRVCENINYNELVDYAELDDTYCRLSTHERDQGLLIDQIEMLRERVTMLEQQKLTNRVKRGLFTLTVPFRRVGRKMLALKNLRLTTKETN